MSERDRGLPAARPGAGDAGSAVASSDAPAPRVPSGPGSTLSVTLEELLDAAPVPADLESGTLFADRYVLGERLGSGGFGVVYRAHDRLLERDVALKLLRTDRGDATSVRRLQREAAVARDVESPHLVRIFDTGLAGPHVYLVVEYLAGGTLRDRLRPGERLAIEEVLRIADALLAALEVLHERGIVHRDVKPSNVLFDERGRAKLGDFGLVTWLGGDLTRSLAGERIVGTLSYLSPEQALGQLVGPASDLYALGVLLFEVLTGELPHPSPDSMEQWLVRLARPAPNLRSRRGEVPRWLGDLVDHLLARRPEDRYASAAAVRSDLSRRRSPSRSGWAGFRRGAGRRVTVASLLAIPLLALGLFAWQERGRRFSHLQTVETAAGVGVRGVDGRGRALWERVGAEGFHARFSVLARVEPGAGPALVTFAGGADVVRGDGREYGRLLVVDPQSGRTRREVQLTRGMAPTAFLRGLPDRFLPNTLRALDLDGDGLDEVIAGYVHTIEWPSRNFLWEPAIDRVRQLLLGSGHLSLAAAQDLDGDGRPELLFSGFNSVLGRYPTLVAARLSVPAGGEPHLEGRHLGGAPTPGLGELMRGREVLAEDYGLLWARLLPKGEISFGMGGQAPVIDPARQLIELRYPGAPGPVRVTFSGGDPDDAVPAEEAAAARFEALRQIEESRRLAGLGDWSGAIAASAAARRESAGVADAPLAECAAREHAQNLIGGGLYLAAEELLAELAADEAAASDAAFTAGIAYHLAGRLDDAVRWYRRGLGPGGELRPGSRQRVYFLEGMFLALGEQGRWSDVITEADRYSRVFLDPERSVFYRTFAEAELGRAPREMPLLSRLAPVDLESLRWIHFELRWRWRGTAAALAATGSAAPSVGAGAGTADSDASAAALAGRPAASTGGGAESASGRGGTPTAADLELDRLLADVRSSLEETFEARGALRSLEAEILAARGDRAAARAAAELAAAELGALRSSNVVSRGVHALVAERLRRLGAE